MSQNEWKLIEFEFFDENLKPIRLELLSRVVFSSIFHFHNYQTSNSIHVTYENIATFYHNDFIAKMNNKIQVRINLEKKSSNSGRKMNFEIIPEIDLNHHAIIYLKIKFLFFYYHH